MTVADTQRGVADAQRGITNTQTVVGNTQTMVADTQTTVADIQTMVADVHRRVLTEQEPTSGQNNSVSQRTVHQHQNSYNFLDTRQVSDTEYCGGL
jgi:hypothetical protein